MNPADALPVLGGLGLFLFGMLSMTEGLRALAGGGLHRFLGRYTKSTLSGAATGAFGTALVQSSSATTVAAVSFVGAGLMSFSQALGIIFGANIGTTITGWMVALVGFKLKLGTMALPIVFVGALLSLFGKRRLRELGRFLAGFAIIFIGLGLLQEGLFGLRHVVMPSAFPGDTPLGRLQLLLIGLVFTLVTQSSSAGVAAAITAVVAGTISLQQAAAMVIGMDVGTTVTAYFATIGGGTQVKRTGYAHVVYNLLTGVMAYLILVPWFAVAERLAPVTMMNSPELVLVAFHTSFNALGVVLVLPFTNAFADMLERMVPEVESPYTRGFDDTLLVEASAALDGAVSSLTHIARGVDLHVSQSIAGRNPDDGELRAACARARDFLTQVPGDGQTAGKADALHIVDHCDRLLDRMAESEHIQTLQDSQQLSELRDQMNANIANCVAAGDGEQAGSSQVWEGFWQRLQDDGRRFRSTIIAAASANTLSVEHAEDLMDTHRWLQRSVYHLWRIHHYLAIRG